MPKLQKILITGYNGFIGSHVGRQLTNCIPYFTDIRPSSSKSYRCDLTDSLSTKRLISEIRPNTIIHTVGLSNAGACEQNPALAKRINQGSTRNLVQACNDVRLPCKFVFLSTAAVYGSQSNSCGFNESTPTAPCSIYGQTKLDAENDLLSDRHAGITPVILRLFNQIGPHQPQGGAAVAFVKKIISSPPGSSILVGDLSATRDFLDVRDTVVAIDSILKLPAPPIILNLGSGVPTKIENIFNILTELDNRGITATPDPQLFTKIDVPSIVCNSELATSVLKWKPKFSLRQSLSDLYQSYKNEA